MTSARHQRKTARHADTAARADGRSAAAPRREGARWARILVALQLICVLLPIAIVVVWAFTASWPFPRLFPESFSARGVAEIFGPTKHLGVTLLQSIGIAVATAALSTIVGTLAARAIECYDFAGKQLFRFATVLPFLIPITVFAMGVQVTFIKAGLANTAFGVILAHSIAALPYSVMIMGNVVHAAGTRLEDQARVLGAGWWQRLIHVQLPLYMPGITSSLSMSYIVSFSQYFLTLLIGGGTVRTLATVMFPFLASGDRTIAAAYGVTFMVVTLAVFFLFEWVLKRCSSHEVRYFE